MAERPSPQPTTNPDCYFSMDHVPQAQAHKYSASTSTASSTMSTSGFSSTSISRSSTPGLNITSTGSTTTTKQINTYKQPQVDAKGQPLDVLARTFPKPREELSVEEALALAPLPGTFRHLAKRAVAEKELTSEERQADLERIKRELRAGLGGAEKKK